MGRRSVPLSDATSGTRTIRWPTWRGLCEMSQDPQGSSAPVPRLRTVFPLVALSVISCVCRLARRQAERWLHISGQSRGNAAGSTGGALAAPAPPAAVAGGEALLQNRDPRLWRHPAAITAARCRTDAPCPGALEYHPRRVALCTGPWRCASLGRPDKPFPASGSRRHARSLGAILVPLCSVPTSADLPEHSNDQVSSWITWPWCQPLCSPSSVSGRKWPMACPKAVCCCARRRVPGSRRSSSRFQPI
jgi:hypothetical protein